MTKRDLPPLRALTAFEAAARLGSFRRAADELGLTRSAISHQIKALEKEIDSRLFERRTRQVKLTAAGLELFSTVKRAFDDIDETASQIRSRSARAMVTLGLGPIIGTRWLAPRLGDFWARHRDIDLRDRAAIAVPAVVLEQRLPQRPRRGTLQAAVDCRNNLVAIGVCRLSEPPYHFTAGHFSDKRCG